MRAEWQRRLLAITYAATFAGISRRWEKAYEAIGLDPVWITRIIAIALLIICFKLADKIPDDSWPRWELRMPLAYGLYIILLAIWLSVLLGLFMGGAH